MLTAWIFFPVLLVALSLGCGLLLEVAVGRRLPGLLLAPVGFGVVVVVTDLVTASGTTAPLATPIVLALAVAGAGLTFPWRGRRPEPWVLGAAIAVFAAYAAPVVLSGDPTFAGYIRLDDTATWLALADHVIGHGRDLSGLEPSSFQTTLSVNLPIGYPVGSFLPLGIGTQVTGEDPAWLVQPYMATMAALLTLCLAWLARPLIESPPLRAAVAFGAAQPALLYGYSLWGGIKEMAVALAIAALAAVAPLAVSRGATWRAALPAAILAATLGAISGTTGLAWILPIFGLAALMLLADGGLRAATLRALPMVLIGLALTLVVVLAAGIFSPIQTGLSDETVLGNLVKPLSVFQYVGIWPDGDFRFDPANDALATFLIALAITAALAGAWFAWRRRAWPLLIYVVGAGVGSLVAFAYGSPWIGAKGLASGAPSFLLLALTGAAVAATRVEKVLGATVLAALLAGVAWSNALAYHDVSLAPYGQLRELERIGEEIDGEGPALMTEYQPYGVRHFLRDADAEGVSELRYHPIALRGGGEAEKGAWADSDEIELAPLLFYPTLVLRRNPAQSRPPSVYSLRGRGPYYEVWQRPPGSEEGTLLEHLPLGEFPAAAAVPPCAEVKRLAALAGPAGRLATVERPPAPSASLASLPLDGGEAELSLPVAVAGRYGVYIEGSTHNEITVEVDGKRVGPISEQLNPAGQFLYFGDAELGVGSHRVTVHLDGQSLAPGSGGPPSPIGPLVLSHDGSEPPVRYFPTSQASALCELNLDWVEAIAPPPAG